MIKQGCLGYCVIVIFVMKTCTTNQRFGAEEIVFYFICIYLWTIWTCPYPLGSSLIIVRITVEKKPFIFISIECIHIYYKYIYLFTVQYSVFQPKEFMVRHSTSNALLVPVVCGEVNGW